MQNHKDISRISMKVYILLLLILLTTIALPQDRGFGVGLIVGEPTGISFTGWLTSTDAIAGGIAWSLTKNPSFHLHADYIWHSYNLINTKGRFPIYYGLGGRAKFGNKDEGRIGIRIVGGVGYFLPEVPLDVFVEIAPVVDLVPETAVGMNGGIGLRYFFK
jgi:hypothetical protein